VAVELRPPAWLFLVLTLVPAAHTTDLPAIRDRGRLRVLTVPVNQQNDFISAPPGKGFDRELLEGFATLELRQVLSGYLDDLRRTPTWAGSWSSTSGRRPPRSSRRHARSDAAPSGAFGGGPGALDLEGQLVLPEAEDDRPPVLQPPEQNLFRQGIAYLGLDQPG
jgi:hypothetical protein